MAILIPNMEMPENCVDCPFCTQPLFGSCFCGADKDNRTLYGGKADFCPLVEAKEPHGELIDRDEVIELFKKYQSELFDYEDILEILQSAKAVVGVMP